MNMVVIVVFMFMLIAMNGELLFHAVMMMSIWNACRSCQQGLVRCSQVLFFPHSPRLNCPAPMLFRFFALHLKGSTFRVFQNVERREGGLGHQVTVSKSTLILAIFSHLCGQWPPISSFHCPSLNFIELFWFTLLSTSNKCRLSCMLLRRVCPRLHCRIASHWTAFECSGTHGGINPARHCRTHPP